MIQGIFLVYLGREDGEKTPFEKMVYLLLVDQWISNFFPPEVFHKVHFHHIQHYLIHN